MRTMLFNPYTGKPRDPRDIASDPAGKLVVDPDEPLYAALPAVAQDEAPEAMARRFHETYERLAPQFGYETREATRTFDPTSPNGRLMIAVCAALAAKEKGQ